MSDALPPDSQIAVRLCQLFGFDPKYVCGLKLEANEGKPIYLTVCFEFKGEMARHLWEEPCQPIV